MKSTLVVFCVVIATGTPCSSQELELVAGVFTFTKYFGVDYGFPSTASSGNVIVEQKLKYPFVSAAPGEEDLLLFLAVHDDQYRLHAYRLEELLRGDLAARAVRSRPDSWSRPDLFGATPPRIKAFFRGGTFLESEDAGQAVLRRVADAKEILTAKSVRDYGHWRDHRAYASSRGLVVDGKESFFDCLEVFSVDYNGDGVFAIGYQDEDRVPRVCLRRKPAERKCDCEPLSEIPEFDPRFSPDGRFFATAARNQDSWDLYVYSLAPDGNTPGSKFLRSVADIAYYDITTESFAYLGSYGWADDQLYFKEKLRSRGDSEAQREAQEARTVHSIKCSENSGNCTHRRLQAPECIRLLPPSSELEGELAWLAADTRPCEEESSRPVVDLDIKEIVWAQPFRHDGETFLAAEAIVRPRYKPELKQGKWLSRILIFRVP